MCERALENRVLHRRCRERRRLERDRIASVLGVPCLYLLAFGLFAIKLKSTPPGRVDRVSYRRVTVTESVMCFSPERYRDSAVI